MLALCAATACCSSNGMEFWSMDCERGFPPSSSEAIPTLVILVPDTVTE
jgi:hypothetical protein